MEEYFDIVDENNILTGERRLRSEAHSQGLWHRVVHILMFRKNAESIDILVHLRAKTKDLHPNKWDTRFGGHIRSGKTADETVLTELQEEVGLHVELADLLIGEVYKRDHFPNREFTSVYYLNFLNNNSELHFNDGEVQKVKWMSLEAIIKSMEATPEQWTGNPAGIKEVIEVLLSKL